MKAAIVLTLLVVAVYSVPTEHWDLEEELDLELDPHVDKRFIGSFKHFVQSVSHKFHDLVDKAKDEFEEITHKVGHVDFHAALRKLMPLVDAGMSSPACSMACKKGASAVLGAAAPVAGMACGPLCKAALAELHKAASR